jgi:transcriptional regulator GlxA family with amidase domain
MPDQPEQPRVQWAAKLVQEVERHLAAAGFRPVNISEICETFNVHERQLHRAFNAVTGVPPITYLRHKRLGDVRTALLIAGPGVTVREVAMAHGFLELGRFAGAYHRLFGELPSQTLRRSWRLVEVQLDASGRDVGTVTTSR